MNNNRITTPFGAQSTAADVIAGIDLSGRRVIVTGGASGIGVETARALAGANAEVTLAVRNLEAGERTAEDIIASMGNKQVLVAPLDLVDQASVAAFVANWDGPLHILVNNAGIMAAAAGGARVVVVSSRAPERGGPVRRHQLRASPLRPVGGVQPVQDGKHPVHGRGGQALGRRRHFGECADARPHPHQPDALHRRRDHRERTSVVRGHEPGDRVEDGGAGCGHLGATRCLATARGRHWPLFRGLQRGRAAAAGHPSRRRGVRHRPGEGCPIVAGVDRHARR